jgi:hypothetical protein
MAQATRAVSSGMAGMVSGCIDIFLHLLGSVFFFHILLFPSLLTVCLPCSESLSPTGSKAMGHPYKYTMVH